VAKRTTTQLEEMVAKAQKTYLTLDRRAANAYGVYTALAERLRRRKEQERILAKREFQRPAPSIARLVPRLNPEING